MKINFKARQLIRSASKGYFSSEFNPKNFKNIKTGFSNSFSYSTFTMVAFDYDLSPILLLSNLSEHTTNILNNQDVSLMLCEEQKMYQFFPKFENKIPSIDYEDPMSRPRITLIGRIKKTNDIHIKKRFLSRHPASKLYSNFGDMNFYKINIKSAHLIGGFAQVKWFKKLELFSEHFKNFKESELGIIEHMNSHHQQSINLYVKNLMKDMIKVKNKLNWKIAGIDPDGFDIRNKDFLFRFPFERFINDAKKLRGIFVKLHKDAIKT